MAWQSACRAEEVARGACRTPSRSVDTDVAVLRAGSKQLNQELTRLRSDATKKTTRLIADRI